MSHIFISHATADDDFVAELRRALNDHDIAVWMDSRNLHGGAILVRARGRLGGTWGLQSSVPGRDTRPMRQASGPPAENAR